MGLRRENKEKQSIIDEQQDGGNNAQEILDLKEQAENDSARVEELEQQNGDLQDLIDLSHQGAQEQTDLIEKLQAQIKSLQSQVRTLSVTHMYRSGARQKTG